MQHMATRPRHGTTLPSKAAVLSRLHRAEQGALILKLAGHASEAMMPSKDHRVLAKGAVQAQIAQLSGADMAEICKEGQEHRWCGGHHRLVQTISGANPTWAIMQPRCLCGSGSLPVSRLPCLAFTPAGATACTCTGSAPHRGVAWGTGAGTQGIGCLLQLRWGHAKLSECFCCQSGCTGLRQQLQCGCPPS